MGVSLQHYRIRIGTFSNSLTGHGKSSKYKCKQNMTKSKCSTRLTIVVLLLFIIAETINITERKANESPFVAACGKARLACVDNFVLLIFIACIIFTGE